MRLVLDLPLAAAPALEPLELLAHHLPGDLHRLREGDDVVRAGPAGNVGLLEGGGADVEEIARHAGSTSATPTGARPRAVRAGPRSGTGGRPRRPGRAGGRAWRGFWPRVRSCPPSAPPRQSR